jgi:Domain of unknown function (DUF4345)
MEANLFLWINGILYLIFSLWCFLIPTKVAGFVGLGLLNVSGKSEFLAVYAGLEMGMALFFLFCANDPALTYAGILFGTFMYVGINIFRGYSIARFGMVAANTRILMLLEIAFAVWGLTLIRQLA